MIRRRGVLLGLALLLPLAACDGEEPVSGFVDLEVEFEPGTALVISETDTLSLAVEVASSEPQRRLGLMHRLTLDPNAGMIFLFDSVQPADNTFWMYNTLIPLSIAYIDQTGTIGSIVHMEPCTSPVAAACPQYAAGVPYVSALEVNRGYFEQHGIGIGDRVVLQTTGS